MIIDTHCHLDDSAFEDKKQIIDNFLAENGKIAINMAVNEKTSIDGKKLASLFLCLYFGVGFHPSDAHYFSENSVKIMEDLSNDEKCVAIGEVGLDYHFEPYDKNEQIEVFERQIDIAYSLKLPISIHSRDATQDTVNILKKKKDKLLYGATMHCFSGSRETAKILLDLGLYISFGGTLTFKNAVNLQEVALFVPSDRILTETDCPYLSPSPLRGTRNEPKNVRLVYEFLSNLRKTDLENLENTVEENTKRLFYKIKK